MGDYRRWYFLRVPPRPNLQRPRQSQRPAAHPLPSPISHLPSVSNPLSLLPFAIAAGDGHIDGTPAASLVAAGFTLLQRSAPLVRALAGHRSAILLPSSGVWLTALAASDGRGAVLVDPRADSVAIAFRLDDAGVGAVFTTRALLARVPSGNRPVVLLDDAPRSATIIVDGAESIIDLGSHFGLDLEGETAEGSDEECAVVHTPSSAGTSLGVRLSHGNLLANARGAVDALSLHDRDLVLAALPFATLLGFTVTMTAPLLAGARVTTMDPFDPVAAVSRIEADGVTILAGTPSMYADLARELERRGAPLAAPALRVCLCAGTPLSTELQDRWFELTGSELRQGYALTEASPLCLFNPPHFPNRRGTLGIPFPGVEVTIRDSGTCTALPQGAAGEICVRGSNVFLGYLHSSDAGLRVRDGWLHTGEHGRERADRTFELNGRGERPGGVSSG